MQKKLKFFMEDIIERKLYNKLLSNFISTDKQFIGFCECD